ncbi:MAG TPA: nitroreductase family protein [Candidatus Kapabacteria bacterium]|nr:nitroreductase family protein [Candidatus Kapabacteria bacterium]
MKTNTAPALALADEFPIDAGADEQLQFLLRYAVLAPSSHNTQPWLFRIQGHELDLIADLNRTLPIVDPMNRELIISCGAALNHLQIAARYFGFSSNIETFPEIEFPDLLARFSVGAHSESHAEDILLFSAIPKRRTYRFAFKPEPVPQALLDVLSQYAERHNCWLHVFNDESARYDVADLISQADRAQWHDKQFRRELAAWVTPNGCARRDGIPGYAQGLGGLSSEAEAFMVRTFDLGNSRAAKDREVALNSPVLAVLGTDCDTREDWLNAGQALSTVLLRARVEDVSASFLNQAIEVVETRSELARLTGRGGLPQILLRMGFGQDVRPTPRRRATEVLLRPKNRPIRLTAENLGIGG